MNNIWGVEVGEAWYTLGSERTGSYPIEQKVGGVLRDKVVMGEYGGFLAMGVKRRGPFAYVRNGRKAVFVHDMDPKDPYVCADIQTAEALALPGDLDRLLVVQPVEFWLWLATRGEVARFDDMGVVADMPEGFRGEFLVRGGLRRIGRGTDVDWNRVRKFLGRHHFQHLDLLGSDL